MGREGARSEGLEDVAEASKAEHMRAGFEATDKALEGVVKAVDGLRNAVGESARRRMIDLEDSRSQRLGGRWGRGLERTVLELFNGGA